MSTTAAATMGVRETGPDLDSAAAVLEAVRTSRANADREELRILQGAVQWAVLHSAESLEEAATLAGGWYGDRPMTVAGPGAPLVAEFSIAEFAAALGLPTEVGKAYLGEAVELRYRLGGLWARIVAGELPAWRGRRIARQTLLLSVEAAGYVDRHLAPVAHKVRPCVVDRLVEEAIARFMPEHAEERRRVAAEGRHFTVHTGQVSISGTMAVAGELDLADALDLDAAVATEAGILRELGSTEPLEVRRARAIGMIARRDLTLDLTPDGDSATTATDTEPEAEPEPDEPEKGGGPGRSAGRRRVGDRRVVLHVHLTQAALAGGGAATVGRCGNTRSPVTAEQVRAWCAGAGQITVQPVLDLADHTPVEAYEIPDRIARQVRLRDPHCTFPWCSRRAERCDLDHTIPHPDGPTSAENLGPRCRSHHRLKTHGAWTCTTLGPGTWLWRSPHGHHYLVDHTGTRPLDGEP